MNRVLALIFLLCLFSCKKKVEQVLVQTEIPEEIDQDEVKTISAMTTNYDTLISRVKKRGDLDAYDELYYGFKDCCFSESTDSVIVYSKIMAEKFNYERAYSDYYSAFLEKYHIDYSNFPQIDISKIDKKEKEKLENWFKVMIKKKLMTQQTFDSIKR